jgi:serine/threonine protein kinase
MSPESISRYKLVRELGRGAMGVVYEASDPNLGRTVALKAILANTVGTNPQEVADRFKNEARAVGGLSHPNIVTVFDAGEDEGVLYIAMECLEGETLEAHLVQRRTIPLERAIDITRQICAALDYANSKGIVHRDIKPANVMLTSDGTVKITDFGLARTTEAITMTGHVVGTPHYMSPEQVRGRPVDLRSDLFSVGVMLYEMLTGERPFEGQSITTIMYKIVHENPTPPRALDSSIPPGLSAVIERALAKSPEERYQSGAALVNALENYKTIRATQLNATAGTTELPAPVLRADTQQISRAAEPGTPAKTGRGKRLWLLSAFVLLAIVGLIAYSRYNKPKAAEQTGTQSEAKPIVLPPVPPPAPATQQLDNAAPAKPPKAGEIVQKQGSVEGKNTATISVNSNPPTATIFLDGKSTNMRTPAQLQLTRGDHVIAVRMQGFQPSSAKFHVRGGEELEFAPDLSVDLPGMGNFQIPKVDIPKIDIEKMTGLQKQKELRSSEFWQQWAKGAQASVTGGGSATEPGILVRTKPGGAHISIDGNDTGQRSPAIIPEKPGTYHVRVQLDGYEPAEREVKAEPGRPAMVNISLKRANARTQ